MNTKLLSIRTLGLLLSFSLNLLGTFLFAQNPSLELVQNQSLSIEEGSNSGTIIGRVQVLSGVASEFRILSAEAQRLGSPYPNDAEINALDIFSLHPETGELSVQDPTQLLSVNGPILLSIEVSNLEGQKVQTLLEINILDQETLIDEVNPIVWGSAAPQPQGNSEAQMVTLNGYFYLFGGFDILKSSPWTPNDRVYRFDPDQDTWTLLNPIPPMHPNTTHGGITHSGFTNDGVDIYFAGGYTSNSSGTGQIFGTKYVYKYIVAEDRYERLPDLPEARAAGELEYVNGRLHYIGGSNLARTEDKGSHFVLDLNNLSASWSLLSPLPNPRNHLGSAVVKGKIYVLGGQYKNDGALITQDDVHIYDPETDQWSQGADLPAPRGHITGATFAYKNKIYVLGGESDHGGPYFDDVLEYDPGSNHWQAYTQLPRTIAMGAAGVINGTLFYSGGRFRKDTYKAQIFEREDNNPNLIQAILVDADKNFEEEGSDLLSIEEGGVYDLNQFLSTNFSIRAEIDQIDFGSIVFALSGAKEHQKTESYGPYLLDGDSPRGDYAPFEFPEGEYQLSIQVFSSSGGRGDILAEKTLNFSLNYGPIQNQAPLVSLGEDQGFIVGSSPLQLEASVSDDALPSNALSYAWTVVEGDASQVVWSNTNQLNPQVYFLSRGIYTLRLEVSDGELSSFDDLLVTVEETTISNELWLEAECAEVGSNWVNGNTNLASNGEYVEINPKDPSFAYSGSAPPAVSANRIRFEFVLDASGSYSIYARTKTPSATDDSYHVSINGAPAQKWNGLHHSSISGFKWDLLLGTNQDLVGGLNTIDFYYRENGAQLDKLYIAPSSSASTPGAFGGVSTNCGAVENQAPIVLAGEDRKFIIGSSPLQLEASVRDDALPSNTLSYAWTVVEGAASQVLWSSAEQLNPQVDFLSLGIYKLRLEVSDGEKSAFDDLVIEVVSEASTGFTVWLEAECAEVGSNWVQTADTEASGGAFAQINPSDGSLAYSGSAPPATAENRVRFSFSLPEGGTYAVYARSNTPSFTDDSYHVSINGAPAQKWNGLHNSSITGFKWDLLLGANQGLVAGVNTIDFYYRENGAQLDKLYLAPLAEATLPSGIGEVASNACASQARAVQAAEVGRPKASISILRVYPNPLVGSELNVAFAEDLEDRVQLSIIDSRGQVLWSGEERCEGKEIKITLPFELSKGIYFLRMEGTYLQRKVEKLIKY